MSSAASLNPGGPTERTLNQLIDAWIKAQIAQKGVTYRVPDLVADAVAEFREDPTMVAALMNYLWASVVPQLVDQRHRTIMANNRASALSTKESPTMHFRRDVYERLKDKQTAHQKRAIAVKMYEYRVLVNGGMMLLAELTKPLLKQAAKAHQDNGKRELGLAAWLLFIADLLPDDTTTVAQALSDQALTDAYIAADPVDGLQDIA